MASRSKVAPRKSSKPDAALIDVKLAVMKWRKIEAPLTWRPSPGEELVGYYAGRTKRDGQFGQYEVLIVAVPYDSARMVSGTRIVQLADAAMLSRGDAVRIKYLGTSDMPSGKYAKQFELYVGEIPRAEDMGD